MKKRDEGLSKVRAFKIQHDFRAWLLEARLARHVNEVADAGPAPMSYLPDGERVIQCDLELVLANAHRTRCIGDVKAKSDCGWWISRQYRVTGIDDRHYQAYMRQSSELGEDALVFFVHVAQGEVRYCSIWSRLWDRGDGDGADMWFVDYDRLPLLATWSGDKRFCLVGEAPFIKTAAGTQLGLELPMRPPPAGVKGWARP